MKKIGIVTYNKYCNFTNYGSALQSFALFTMINRLGINYQIQAIMVDYCPEILKGKDPLNPLVNMWDKDIESKNKLEMSMPAIRINYEKFTNFYENRFKWTKFVDTSNFNKVGLSLFACGSDTIFCTKEFGFDDGYYARYSVMKSGYSFSYAASFGDSVFDTKEKQKELADRIIDFKALGIREDTFVPLIKKTYNGLVMRVIDPTLLLKTEDYDAIASSRLIKEDYLLLYSRRYDEKMEKFADSYASSHHLKVVEISLQAQNKDHHIMYYEAGVEEFLSLVKYSSYVVTNSFHGAIFSIQFHKQLAAFTREQADEKITQLLSLAGIEHSMYNEKQMKQNTIDYTKVDKLINVAREKSISFLCNQIEEASKWKAS